MTSSNVSTTSVNDQLLLVGQVSRGSFHQAGAPLLRWNRDFRTVTELPTPETGQAVA